jgi:hypothetical protein
VRILHPLPKEYAALQRSDLLNDECLNPADKSGSVTFPFGDPPSEWSVVNARFF